ncbi:conserved hypothetical protein [Leishmania braziliensis MHOM/BR/75/M2904]|uniref:HORMA domain-containing protein n=2 Tax=Leishmania braziliensis TaxID=5660 RepID=A4HNX1_LEIBR|nr:conserved hypothetical protein [Leishmania braziliensis MHOM/BR/75/M2904]CAJ2481275.1 unnamed protein product [Leishmania braziliensis]CAM43876.1 conserved hypothetical protein [Leishmania braziliensis MHOM/BR/75/M2904]SYZ69930.1 HORMA_domain_containing_protein [Leishmania braziliensis MHOM/BR/75/M2904]
MTSTVAAVSQTQSLAAIRNFVRASVSCITYARGLCSDNAFEQRPFLGLPLRQLIPSTTESITISEWIEKGAFDALNRHYLKEMSLCVFDAECRELLENYCFGFNYTDDGKRAQMTLNTPPTIAGGADTTALSQSSGSAVAIPAYRKRRCTKQEVQLLLTSILGRLMDVVESLPPLLSERVLTMRLTYYDEVTPASYEPPCFAPASEHMTHLYQDEVKHRVHLGSMDTSHHLFSVALRHPLLLKIHSQVTDRTAPRMVEATARAQSAAVVTPSDPLRSGLESSFSSEPVLASAAAQGSATVMPAMTRNRASCRPFLSTDGERAAVDTVSYEEEDARNCSFGEGCGGAGDTIRTGEALQPCEVAKLDGVHRLIGKSSSDGERPGLKAAELTYLLFAALVLTKSPSARGGRGQLTSDDVEAYRTRQCPFDISAKAAQLVLQRLSTEGFLQQCDVRGVPAQKTPRIQEGSRPSPAIREWTVSDPSVSLLQQLMQLGALTELLTHESHHVLQVLYVHLAREESRRAPRAMAAKATLGRISTTGGSRKRWSR